MKHRWTSAVLPLLILLAPWTGAMGEDFRLLTEESPPFNMALPDGRVGGMSTELLHELFRRTGLPYRIELQPWARAISTARQENNTCVYSTTRNPDREHQFKWVGPLLADPWVLYGGPASPKGITRLEDTRPYSIGDYTGDAEAQFLIDRGYNVELSPTDESSVQKLARGRIDFWATGIYVGNELVHRDHLPQLKPVLQFNTAQLYLACNPGIADSTIDRLNRTLQQMERDGFSNRIRQRYAIE